METHNKEEAEKVIREQRVSNAERLRRSEEFNPGLNPQGDRYGTPEEGPDPRHYPDRFPVAPDGDSGDPMLGGTDSDRKEGINVDELDRTVHPTGEPE